MHNDKIDFSALQRITPREDSWNKVCARLDMNEILYKSSANKKFGNVLQFRMSAIIPLAATFICIFLYLLLTASNINENRPISMDSVTSSDFISWYGSLGEDNADEYEILDNATTISYLMKE